MSNSASSKASDQSSSSQSKGGESEEAEYVSQTDSETTESVEESSNSDLDATANVDESQDDLSPPADQALDTEPQVEAESSLETSTDTQSDQATPNRKSRTTKKGKSEETDSSDKPAKQKKTKTKAKSNKKSDKAASNKSASLLGRISDVTSSAFKFARKTTDTSYKVGKAIIQSQDQLKLMVAAGQSLKDLREVAGLTISELNDSLQLKDKTLLEAVEDGTATLSFELILRLSALLARNDPIPFILKYSRTYSPETWKLLNDWGAGRLPIQYQREREFINIFRSKDQARQLSDEGYNKVLEFTREAFNMSLHFVSEQETSVKELKETLKAQAEAELKKDSSKDEPAEE